MSSRRDPGYRRVVVITACTIAGLSFGIVNLTLDDARIDWTPPVVAAALAVIVALLLSRKPPGGLPADRSFGARERLVIIACVGMVPLMSELSTTWQVAILLFIDVMLTVFLGVAVRNAGLNAKP